MCPPRCVRSTSACRGRIRAGSWREGRDDGWWCDFLASDPSPGGSAFRDRLVRHGEYPGLGYCFWEARPSRIYEKMNTIYNPLKQTRRRGGSAFHPLAVPSQPASPICRLRPSRRISVQIASPSGADPLRIRGCENLRRAWTLTQAGPLRVWFVRVRESGKTSWGRHALRSCFDTISGQDVPARFREGTFPARKAGAWACL